MILLVERALAVCLAHPKTIVTAVDTEDNSIQTISAFWLMQDLVLLANSDSRANSVLSYLSTGGVQQTPADKASSPLLNINILRSGSDLPSAPQLSAYAIKHIVKINAFGFSCCREPGEAGRKAMVNAMRVPICKDDERSAMQGAERDSPLMMALMSPQTTPETLTSMISKTSKADLNRAYLHGVAPLHVTVFRSNEYACKALLRAGARPDVKDEVGMTPLYYAVGEFYNMNIATALVQHGASVNEAANSGHTPLHVAVECSKADVQILTRRTALIICQLLVARRGSATLLCARPLGMLDTIQTLLRAARVCGPWLAS
jgi:ankyrin repeat protein